MTTHLKLKILSMSFFFIFIIQVPETSCNASFEKSAVHHDVRLLMQDAIMTIVVQQTSQPHPPTPQDASPVLPAQHPPPDDSLGHAAESPPHGSYKPPPSGKE